MPWLPPMMSGAAESAFVRIARPLRQQMVQYAFSNQYAMRGCRYGIRQAEIGNMQRAAMVGTVQRQQCRVLRL